MCSLSDTVHEMHFQCNSSIIASKYNTLECNESVYANPNGHQDIGVELVVWTQRQHKMGVVLQHVRWFKPHYR